MPKPDMNGPRCPICNSVLALWSYAGEGVKADCTNSQCSWEWSN